MTTATKTETTARNFADACNAAGWNYEVRGEVLTIRKAFTPGDNAAYVAADMEAGGIMDHAKATRSGSTWGTTSDGVGGHVGCKNGLYQLNKSGVAMRFLAALAKIQKNS